MTEPRPTRTRLRRSRWTLVAGLLVVVAAIAAALRDPMLPSASSLVPSSLLASSSPPVSSSPLAPSTATAPLDVRAKEPSAPGGQQELRGKDPGPRGGRRVRLDKADGILPEGTTVFDAELPGIANLEISLLRALRQAAIEAERDGVEIVVESGWRSPEYQAQLLREAVSTYGSKKVAARWVATAATSPHTSGDAVDIGSLEARTWLSKRGAAYGLCQVYRNEPWHYESRPYAVGRGCPRMYANPTRDPRMQE